MRAGGVPHHRQRKIKIRVIALQAGDAARCYGDAVIATMAADDLLLARASQRIVVVPDQLDRAVIGLRSRVREEHLGHRHRRQLDQALRQFDPGGMALEAEHVIAGELHALLVSGLRQTLLAEAERDRPQPGYALDIALALVVLDIDALAPLNDQRSLLGMLY